MIGFPTRDLWWQAIGRHGDVPRSGAGDLSMGATVGAIGVGFMLALVMAAYLFYKLFPIFFGTPLLGVLKQ